MLPARQIQNGCSTPSAVRPEGVARYKQAAALRSVGQAEDVANACLFLVSRASKWITGVDLVVDGGALTDKIF